jgi:hypothetical protein
MDPRDDQQRLEQFAVALGVAYAIGYLVDVALLCPGRPVNL